MPSKPVLVHSVCTPSTCATALPRSMSMPIGSPWPSFRNSLGAYEASVAMRSTPASAMLAGSSAAIVSSFGRFKSSGSGSPLSVPSASDDDSAGASDDDSAGASVDAELSAGASDDDSTEVCEDAPSCGFSVLAPQAD